MPGVFKLEDKEEIDDKDLWLRTVNAEIDHEQMLLGINYIKWTRALPAEEHFSLQRKVLVGPGMEVTRESSLTMDGFPAREFIRESDDLNFIERLVVRGADTISASVFGDRGIHSNPTVRRFFASFALLGAR